MVGGSGRSRGAKVAPPASFTPQPIHRPPKARDFAPSGATSSVNREIPRRGVRQAPLLWPNLYCLDARLSGSLLLSGRRLFAATIVGARDEQAMDALRRLAGFDDRLAACQIIGELVAFGHIAAVAQRDVAEQPNLVLVLVVDAAVAGGDLGLRGDRHRAGGLHPPDLAGRSARRSFARRRRRRGLLRLRAVLGRGFALGEKDRQSRAGQFAVALDGDDIAGIDRLLLLVVVNQFVGVDRDRLLGVGARQDRRRIGRLGRGGRRRGGDGKQEGCS